ncbi:aminopeptidase P family N-terminal domain-containing protein, partial [Hungatella effluvii]|uniref:aminopeptidase P family N-terminal domain-containing protein n=1 Tax=Hungatella effluvii TaxID=1096246 RepID=UPI002A81417A
MVSERIKSFRKLMKRMGIDAYMIPSADFHSSEYVGEYFKCREHLSGFTGSAGTLVITASEAGLWVDGRYFVQAETQLAGTGIDLYRSGEAGVPDITAFLNSRLPQNGVLGFDGRSAAEKLEAVRSAMGKQGADFHILTTLDDIAWVLNIRGSDVRCTPVSLAYLVLSKSECFLFTEVDPEGGGSGQIIPPETAAHLKSLSVKTKPYHGIYEFVRTLRKQTVLLEMKKANYALYDALDSSNRIIDAIAPSSLMKSVKNPVEMDHMRRVHIRDGIAVTRFMRWVKTNVGRFPIDEIAASNYLDGLRRDQGCLDQSFPTISAYGEHAAMCHYIATPESKKDLE